MRFHLLLFLITFFSLTVFAATGMVSVDPGEPGFQNKKSPKGQSSREVQVGRYKNISPQPAGLLSAQFGSTVRGIFAVFETGGRWMLVERLQQEQNRLVTRGARFVVIGADGIDNFYAQKSTYTLMAGCDGYQPVPTLGYLLSAASAAKFKKVGHPIIAILIRGNRSFNISKAKFYRLDNQVNAGVYKKYEPIIREQVVQDLKAGRFLIKVDDYKGHQIAAQPQLDSFDMIIEYGVNIQARKFKEPFLTIEGVQVSSTYRRCLRLIDGFNPVGQCIEMPRELTSETNNLEFIAYDPIGSGNPFVLAYNKQTILWGDERWGFQLTAKGPKLFLRDALDPRCRESF